MIDANEVAAKMVKAGEEWADLDAAACLLEETKSSLLALLADEAPVECTSVAARDEWARRQLSYEIHLKDMTEARRKANRAKVKWISIQAWSELIRSQEASRRAEMNLR